MALEEAALIAASMGENGPIIQLWEPMEVHLPLDEMLRLTYEGGDTWNLESSSAVMVSLRIPPWGSLKFLPESSRVDGGYLFLELAPHQKVAIELDCPIKSEEVTYTLDHHGQEIVREDFVCFNRGGFVYALGAVDGYRFLPAFRLPKLNPTSAFRIAGDHHLEMSLPGKAPIQFSRYFEAGGRHDGSYHTTWLTVEWQ